MIVKITPNKKANPPGKLCDAELHFTEGPLEGLKLIGFSCWERRMPGKLAADETGNHSRSERRNVTFPARQYSVNGERRSFSLLRPSNSDGLGSSTGAQDRIRDLILQAYREWEQAEDIDHRNDEVGQ